MQYVRDLIKMGIKQAWPNFVGIKYCDFDLNRKICNQQYDLSLSYNKYCNLIGPKQVLLISQSTCKLSQSSCKSFIQSTCNFSLQAKCDTVAILRSKHHLLQCNLDYPDLVYPEPRLSGLAGDQKVHYHAWHCIVKIRGLRIKHLVHDL